MPRRRQAAAGVGAFLLVALAGLGAGGPAASADDIKERKERQKEIQAETDRLVRRVETMIWVLDYNGLDKAALARLRATLSGLSKEQMARLIEALEKAQKAKGPARTKELKEAAARHEQVVLTLKGLLAEFDAVKNLEQAAGRLDKLARDQVDLFLRVVQVRYESENKPQPRRGSTVGPRIEQSAAEQGFLLRDVTDLLKQVGALKAKLPPDQKALLAQAEARLKAEDLTGKLEKAARCLKATGTPANRHVSWLKGADLQWECAGELAELARLLRPTPEKLTALREARQRVTKAIEDQQKLKEDVAAPPEPAEGGAVEGAREGAEP